MSGMRRAIGLAMPVLALALLPMKSASAQVQFERVGYRLTSIGDRISVSARSAGSRRAAAPRMRWRIADSTIATVNAGGVVVSRRPGYTRLWAIAGSDSASTLILVDQWAAKFEFFPAIVRLDAVGSKIPVRINVRDAGGHLISDQARRAGACRSVNERIAVFAANGELTARSTGVTYVRCTDRGIADSVRVEVRPRPTRMQIADKLIIANKTVGDTFRIRLNAFDRVGDEIHDVQATWASLNPTIMRVDPVSGMARSVGAGAAKIVAQVGDITDTVSIAVQPNANMPMAVEAALLTGVEAPRVPTLALQSLYLMVGDTGRVTVTAKDAQGNIISNPLLAYHANDSTIVRPVSLRNGLGWVAHRTGVTYVVAQFGTVVDSLQVSVRAKGTAVQTLAGGAVASVFVRPTWDTLALRRAYAQRLDSAARAIKRQSIVKEVTGRMLALSLVAGQVAHSAHLSDVFTESRTGLMYGGNAELAPLSWFKAVADLRTGALSTNRPTGEEMTVTEAEGQLIFSPAEWFGFGGGYLVRYEKTDLATQRWTIPRVSAVTRFTFVGGAITTVTGFSVLPAASYTGYADSTGKAVEPNPFSLAGEAGLEVRQGILTAGLTYYVERFTFPLLAGQIRRDQFSALRLRVGLQVGR